MAGDDNGSVKDDTVSKSKSQKDSDPTGTLIIDHRPAPPPPPEAALPAPKTPKSKPVPEALKDPVAETPVSTTDIDSQLAQIEDPKAQYSKRTTPATGSFDFPSGHNSPITSYADEQQASKIKGNLLKKVFNSLTPLSKICIAVAALLVIGFLIFHSGIKYKKFTIKNGGFTYSFEFYADSVPSLIGSHQQVTGNESDTVDFLVFESPYQQDCHKEFPTYKVVSKVKLQSQTYSVCSVADQTAFISSFEYNSVWQQAVVYSTDGKSTVNIRVAAKAIQSLKII